MPRGRNVRSQRLDELQAFIQAHWPVEVFRRFQCIWLSQVVDLPPQAIAEGLGLSVSTVRRLRAEFMKSGVRAIDGKGNRGGRRHQYMSFEEEAEFLREFVDGGGEPDAVDAMSLKRAFEARIGNPVHKTTIYRLLERHGLELRPALLPDAGQEAETSLRRRSGRRSGK